MNVQVETKDPVTGAVLQAAFEVARVLGHGFLESVYQKALLEELTLRGIAAAREVAFPVTYKGREIGTYVADLIVEDQVVVELKACEGLGPAHTGQCLNYLRASGLRTAKIEYRRVTL
ncbi:MAG: GxxExxY protein [Actinomycetota bacterium]